MPWFEESVIGRRSKDPHLPVSVLARHLEGRLGEIERATVRAHLRACRECFELYRDCALELGLDAARGETVETGVPGAADLVGLGVRIAGGRSGWAREGAQRPLPPAGTRRWLRWETAAAAAAVAGAVWFLSPDRGSLQPLSPEILRPIEVAVETYSRLGEFVLPGGEAGINGTARVYRSVHVSPNDSLSAALKSIFDGPLREDRSPSAAYWYAAGNLALGRTSLAREWTESGRERYPDDPRLLVLDAAIAREQGEDARAEDLLRVAVTSLPRGPLGSIARFDLAVVLLGRGQSAEAKGILRDVRDSERDGPLGERADIVLRSLAEF